MRSNLKSYNNTWVNYFSPSDYNRGRGFVKEGKIYELIHQSDENDSGTFTLREITVSDILISEEVKLSQLEVIFLSYIGRNGIPEDGRIELSYSIDKVRDTPQEIIDEVSRRTNERFDVIVGED